MLRHMLIRWALLGLMFVGATAQAQEHAKLLILGDSMSSAYGLSTEQGWVALLAQRLAKHSPGVKVVNASIAGETTAGGLTRLPALLQQHQPQWVVVELGGNDGLRGLSLKQMRQNLNEMLALSHEAGARTLLVGIRIPTNYGAAYRNRFEGTFERVAEQHRVPLVPRLLEGIGEQAKWFQDDGIHPTAEAQSALLDNVWVGLEPLLSAAP